MMTFDKNTKAISINRGDRGTIRITNTLGNFKVGDKLKFSIVAAANYNNVVFQKTYVVTEEGPDFYLTLNSEDTRIGDVISKPTTYNYEVEYNNDYTLIGYDKTGSKNFILYPEAPNKDGGDV